MAQLVFLNEILNYILLTLGFWRFYPLKMHPCEKVRGALEC